VNYWFRRYKKDDFDMEDKKCLGQPKKFEEEVEALLDQDPSQRLGQRLQEELAESLNV